MVEVECKLEEKLEQLGGVMLRFIDIIEKVEHKVDSLNLALDGLIARMGILEDKMLQMEGVYED